MPSRAHSELIDVYLAEPGQGRPAFSFEPGALARLPSDGPLPMPGDVLLLPRDVTGDNKKQTFAWGDALAPFLVLEREHVYARETDAKNHPAGARSARYVRTVVLVRRLTKAEFQAGPGQPSG